MSIIHNLDASEKVASWSYSQAAGARALAWLHGEELVHAEPCSGSCLEYSVF